MNAVLKIKQIARYQARKTALKHAYAAFASQYNEWTEYLFDEHFVDTRIASLLETDIVPSVTTVVNAWADQMTWPKQDARQRTMADLMPAAAYFLQMLAAEQRVDEMISEAVPQSA